MTGIVNKIELWSVLIGSLNYLLVPKWIARQKLPTCKELWNLQHLITFHEQLAAGNVLLKYVWKQCNFGVYWKNSETKNTLQRFILPARMKTTRFIYQKVLF